jgi:ubiquinone/menaquinone biosynthesis C-methylase UbiE
VSDEIWDEPTCRRYADGMRPLVARDHRPWAQRLAGHLPARASPVVVELAAGPGFLLLELGALVPGAELIAVDDAAAMLAIQREEAQRAGRSLRRVLGHAQQTGLPDGCADAVVCKNLLNCLEDRTQHPAVLQEMHRLLRPGGLAAVIDFDDDGPSLVASALTAYVRSKAGRRFAVDFADAWKRRLHAPDMLRLVQQAGFVDCAYQRRLITFLIDGRRAGA